MRVVLTEFDPICFVHTTDLARARRFYVDVLGLEFVEESSFAVVLRSGRTTIRVTPVESHSGSAQTVLGWSVPDLGAVLTGLIERGVQPLRYDGFDQDQQGVWRAPSGASIVWFIDPDRNTLSLTQF